MSEGTNKNFYVNFRNELRIKCKRENRKMCVNEKKKLISSSFYFKLFSSITNATTNNNIL